VQIRSALGLLASGVAQSGLDVVWAVQVGIAVPSPNWITLPSVGICPLT
jgi:hypothetical protein